LPDEVRQSQQESDVFVAIRVWNMLGGQLDWQGLEAVAALFGVDDIEILIYQLEVIRGHGRRS
jgi:hypothetical protein